MNWQDNAFEFASSRPLTSSLHYPVQIPAVESYQDVPNSEWPSSHSPGIPSSLEHIPTLERNFCSNFTCCGHTLSDLHALIAHFEETHVIVLDANGQPLPFPHSLHACAAFQNSGNDNSYESASPVGDSDFLLTPTDMLAAYTGHNHQIQPHAHSFPCVPDYPALAPANLSLQQQHAHEYECQQQYQYQYPSVSPTSSFSSLSSDLETDGDQDIMMDFDPLDSDASLSPLSPSFPSSSTLVPSSSSSSTTSSPGSESHSNSPTPVCAPPALFSFTPVSPHPHKRHHTPTIINLETAPSDLTPTPAPTKASSKIGFRRVPKASQNNRKRDSNHPNPSLPPLSPTAKSKKAREKTHRCPRPGCTKSYLNPNGLKYHQEKGTCTIASAPCDAGSGPIA